MIRIFLIFFFFTLLASADQYPKLFSQLGTPLYKADEVFRGLSSFEKISDNFTQYHIHVQKLLKLASAIESNPKADKKTKQEYVKGLRDLQQEHDHIIRMINGYLLESIDNNDYAEFSRIMNKDIGIVLENSVIRKRTMAYYVAHRTRGRIKTLDISYQTLESDPELMEYVRGHMPKQHKVDKMYSSGGTSHTVVLSKDEKTAFIADGTLCLKTVNIRNFASASEISDFDFHADICDIVDIKPSSDGDYLYLSDEQNGFTIVDVTQPLSLLQKAEYRRLRAISAFPSVDGAQTFVIRKTKGLSIFDTSDKEEFKLLANYNRGLAINHLALDENRSRLYLSHDTGISVLDISQIGNPREVISYPLQGGANNIILSPDKRIAYVASDENGIYVLDLSSEEKLSTISTCLTPKYAKQLTLSANGEKLYVAALEDGVYTIDTKDPKELRHISTYQSTDPKAIALSSTLNKAGDTLYISFSKAGIAKVTLQDDLYP